MLYISHIVLQYNARRKVNMTIGTLSSKGQITLPAAARRSLGLHEGDKVAIETRDGEIVVRRARNFFDLKGCLGKALPRHVERNAMRLAATGSGKA
jgi:AbrB family looped-hinge helix DNA binding protein